MFNGRFDHAIDEKGRVSIPSRFREVLQREGHDRLYITNFIIDHERLLELFPPNEWEKVVAKFSGSRATDREAQLYETFYIGGAHEVPVDRQGRILIPPRLREFARLRKSTFDHGYVRIGRDALRRGTRLQRGGPPACGGDG